MKFIAEIRKVEMKKTASLDAEYRVVFVTNDSSVLALGAIPTDETVEVEVNHG